MPKHSMLQWRRVDDGSRLREEAVHILAGPAAACWVVQLRVQLVWGKRVAEKEGVAAEWGRVCKYPISAALFARV